jgi:hypothetical protein
VPCRVAVSRRGREVRGTGILEAHALGEELQLDLFGAAADSGMQASRWCVATGVSSMKP